MAKRNPGRRARSRKRRPPTAQASERPAQAAPTNRVERAQRRPAQSRPQRDPGGVGERPQAPWHPLPLSELLILVGMIGTVVGLARQAAAVLFAGLGAVLLGTLDFSIREHLSGYRSHTTMLAAIPTALFHGGAALGLSAAGAPSTALIAVPLVLDVPLFAVLFKLLRARFQDARRERVQGL